jgi:hypothetical protein
MHQGYQVVLSKSSQNQTRVQWGLSGGLKTSDTLRLLLGALSNRDTAMNMKSMGQLQQ